MAWYRYSCQVSVLVTGGAGYIGSHLVRMANRRGDRVVVVDDLTTGIASRIGNTPLVHLDLSSDYAVDALESVLRDHEVSTVVHFAARKQVGESVARPAWYFKQNLNSLANLLLAMESVGVQQLVFSSSASVYAPSERKLSEDDETKPANPYGETKLLGEWLVEDAVTAWALRAVSLRYFNVAGAIAPGLGDSAALNLIPMVIERIVQGEAPVIFGADYPSPDGTCIRDFVHVQDVAEAHLAAIDAFSVLANGHHVFNVGTGNGRSVREIIGAVIDVAGVSTQPKVVGRRPGDPAIVVAEVSRIRESLGWSARFGLDEIVRSAWAACQHAARRK